MSVVKEPQAEPIPGYRLLEPLGSGGFGEVWKCEAPGGLFKAIKFVYGNLNGLEADRGQAEEELRAVQRIKTIRHPFLLSMDRVESKDGELMIVTELADRNLHDVFTQCRQQGQLGIPRNELLGYLAEAAEVLDLLNIEYQLQHLDIKPRNLFLVRKHVKVADFGLVNSMGGGSAAVSLGAITPIYAPPEVFQGRISPHCDQYSLAIVYMELLTGHLPFAGKNSRQLLMQHCATEPDLSSLSKEDQEIVGRALAKDSKLRFPTCCEFIGALVKARAEIAGSTAETDPLLHLERDQQSAPTRPAEPAGTTAALCGPDTVSHAAANAPSYPGFRFLEALGSSMLFDAWKVEDIKGRQRVLRFLYGFAGREPRQIQDALVRLEALNHPGLWPFTVLDRDRGRLVLLSDPVRPSLKDRFQECVNQRLPGVPRRELLGYLHTAAEVVDYLYEQHGVHHLQLRPRVLAVGEGRLQVADFGLAHLLWVPAGQPVAKNNARYAASELFDGLVSRTGDQFSLAMIYQEMLTGSYPYRGPNRRDRDNAQPDLSKLPESDRPIIARALDPDPANRWPNCGAMLAALEHAQGDGTPSKAPGKDRFTDLLAQAAPDASQPQSPEATDALQEIIDRLVASVGTVEDLNATGDHDCEAGELRHKFRAGVPVGAARLKLDACRAQWYGRLVRDEDNAYIFHVSLPSNFWQNWTGRQPGLEVRILLARPHPLTATPIDVTVTIRPFRCNKSRSGKLLEDLGKPILDSVRKCLLVNAEKRTQDRVLWPYPVTVRPVLQDGKQGPAVECRGKDISLTGMGFYLPHELPSSQICIKLPSTGNSNLALPATLVRAQRCADGWYEVGALFSLTKLRQTLSELTLP